MAAEPGSGIAVGSVLKAIVSGALVSLLAGSATFALLFPLNAGFHPEIPWLAFGELVFVPLFLAWLNGWGPPRASAAARRFHLRLWRGPVSHPRNWPKEAWLMVAAILALNVVYLGGAALAGPRPAPDLSMFPTTALRFSAFIMGPLLSGVGEEAGVRGVMQSQLERYGPGFAISASSVVFVLSHLTHGWAILPMLPGYFVVSVLYGVLAWRTGSILPSMVLHVLGDLAEDYWLVLGGTLAPLFVG